MSTRIRKNSILLLFGAPMVLVLASCAGPINPVAIPSGHPADPDSAALAGTPVRNPTRLGTDEVTTRTKTLLAQKDRSSGAMPQETGMSKVDHSSHGNMQQGDAVPAVDHSAHDGMKTNKEMDIPAVKPGAASVGESAPEAPAPVYTCVMHPEIQEDTPGKCPICGMKLVPKTDEAKTTKSGTEGHNHGN